MGVSGQFVDLLELRMSKTFDSHLFSDLVILHTPCNTFDGARFGNETYIHSYVFDHHVHLELDPHIHLHLLLHLHLQLQSGQTEGSARSSTTTTTTTTHFRDGRSGHAERSSRADDDHEWMLERDECETRQLVTGERLVRLK